MSRGIKRQPTHQPPPPAPEPYPEHVKMYPHTQTNWAIREFWMHLRDRGLTDLTWDEMDDALLAWRGVDKLEYRAEAADMRSKYRWLWEKFEPRHPELGQVIDETKPTVVAERESVVVARAAGEDAITMLLSRIREGRHE